MEENKELETDQQHEDFIKLVKSSYEQGFIDAVRIANGLEPKYKNIHDYLKSIKLTK
jgi:hypothetical protein